MINDIKPPIGIPQEMAKPLHIQRLEAALNVGPFMQYAQNIISRPLSSSEDSDSEENEEQLEAGYRNANGIVSSKRGMMYFYLFDTKYKQTYFSIIKSIYLESHYEIICNKFFHF